MESKANIRELASEVSGADRPKTLLGWREWAQLPEIGIPWIKVKIDTGARSSALHAFDVRELSRDRVSFRVQPWQDSDADAIKVVLPIHDRRVVRSSSGHAQERIVVLVEVCLAGRAVQAETTLTNRDQMGFRMLAGREVLRQGFLVDPGRSFVGGRAPREFRRLNRGRA